MKPWLRIHLLCLLVILVPLATGCSDNDDDPDTPWPGGKWTPDPETYGMVVVEDVPVTMDDGVILHADIGYPTDLASGEIADGTFPVLLSHNPYTGRSPEHFFVSRGYIHAIAEVRGTGESQLSAVDPDGPLPADNRGNREARDGAMLVDWAANIDRSNGRLGLYGCSWLGINQILTAGELERFSPVKAMIPACAGQNYGIFFVGGVAVAIVQFFDAAAGITGAKHSQENAAAGRVLKADILAGGDRAYNRNYWQERTSSRRVERIVENNIPTLLWTGWEAAEAVVGGIDLYAALQNAEAGRDTFQPMPIDPRSTSGKYQIIVGPGGHGEGLDNTLQLLWYDHWVKQRNTGIDRIRTGMHLYELGTDRWINHDSWPITDDYTTYYLTDDGLDTTAMQHSVQLAFGEPTEPGTTFSYETAPLESEMTLAGPIGATFNVRSTSTNAHIHLALFVVNPDGEALEISEGGLIASARELDPARSWSTPDGLTTKPEGTFTTFAPIEPGEVYELQIKMEPTLRRIAQGDRLRLVVSTQAGQSRCIASLGLGRASPCIFNAVQLPTLEGGVFEVLSDAGQPSQINLPLVDPETLTTARSDFTETSPDQTQPLDWGDSGGRR